MVVAIILVMAAMAVPNLVASRIAANEAAAVTSIRAINTAQTAYAITYPNKGFADTLLKLAEPKPGVKVSENAAGLLDWVLGCASEPCTRSGYNFAFTNVIGAPGVVTQYDVTAVPASRGQTGNRGFCGSNLTILRFDPNGGVNCTLYLP